MQPGNKMAIRLAIEGQTATRNATPMVANIVETDSSRNMPSVPNDT